MGYVLSANDRSRNRTSSRLGVSLRPFYAGDRIGALSLSHLMRTDELLTRVDESRGQVQVRIFILTHPSLDFRSDFSTCTKGQVILGLAGIIEALHTRQNQSVRIYFCSRETLKNHLQSRRRTQAEIYVLSDFLDETLTSDLAVMKDHGINKAAYFCVRDSVESPLAGNPLVTRISEIEAFVGGEQTRRFSGKTYGENLNKEFQIYQKVCRDSGSSFHLFTENDELYSVVQAITNAYALASIGS